MPTCSLPFRAGLRPVAAAALLSTLFAGAAYGQVAPSLQRSAVSLGQQRPSASITGTVWLQLHNKAALDAAVKDMYTPGSASYQKFASTEAMKQFAPTADEMASVKKQLAAHNLSVVSADPHNFAVKIQGQTSDFEAAFHTTVNQYRKANGAVVSALATAPSLTGGAAGLVRAVTGISTRMQPYILHPVDPATGKQIGIVPVAANPGPNGAYYSSACLYTPKTVTFTGPGTAAGTTAIAAYNGVAYGANDNNTTPGTVAPCGYSPQDEYRLAGLDAVYGQGYTGKGQTIAIVDAYGSPTINADLATFNSIYHLPAANSTNFKVLSPAPVTGADAGWAEETTLDVEWSHAIAPDANIVLVATPTNYNDDLQAGVMYVIENHIANVISNSYGLGELESDPQSVTSWDEICELAAFEGISVNFSSGDSGDFALQEDGTTDVSSPASSPYATAVGGTSAAFNPVDGTVFQTGWGTNLTRLATSTKIQNPPLVYGFQFGAGGGVSQYFKKPAYQSALSGTGREVPDVAALADPYTGVEIIFTESGNQYYVAIGGTSLASPIFTAEWALLDQRFGFPLGQAAPYIAQYASSGAITDVLPAPMQFSVQGAIQDGSTLTTYSAETLGAPETDSPFLGTLYHSPYSGSTFDLTFGTDSSLPVTQGWDPVTGWGTLNMRGIFSALSGQ